MAIGTSLGGFFKDKMDMHLGIDQNVIKPADTGDNNEITPMQLQQNKDLDRIDQEELGGIDV